MKYDVLTKKYEEIAEKFSFIFKETPRIIDPFREENYDVSNIERNNPHGLKDWNDLSLDDQQKFLNHLSKMDHDEGEQALLVDLMLYTMRAPGYENLKRTPSEVNNPWGGLSKKGTILVYKDARLRSGYSRAFKALQAEIPGLANSNGWSFLMDAIQKGDNDRLKRMLEKATDDEKKKLLSQVTTAKYAIGRDKVEFQVKNKYRKEPEVEILNPGFKKDDNGSTLTPLIVAVRLGNLNAFDMLLKAGADVNQKDSSDKTALDWARETMEAEKDLNKKAVFEKMVERLDPSKDNDGRGTQTPSTGGDNKDSEDCKRIINGNYLLSFGDHATKVPSNGDITHSSEDRGRK